MVARELIGSSPKFRAVLDQINMIAPVDCTVLLRGETGTGKEVVAHAIHDLGARRHKRFVALNCAAIPAALFESELFGHEKGAFTGAFAPSTGRFQAANGGTLFLDEIGDLPLELQPKLLRVLQEQQFERIGSGQTIQVDVRVIAATNQDLWSMVCKGKFRADLYYRLNVFPIELPPLRERKEDIPELIEHLARKFAARYCRSIVHIPEQWMQVLKSHHWPGNIRELQNFIERAGIMPAGLVLRSLTAELERQCGFSGNPRTFNDAQRAHITSVLLETNWVLGGRNGAAARLGLPRTTLIAMMRKLGISRNTLDRAQEPDISGVGMPSTSAAEYLSSRDDRTVSLAGDHVVAADGDGSITSNTSL